MIEEARNRLKDLRMSRGYKTASDAARSINMNVATYIGLENGNSEITRKSAQFLAEAFGTTPEYLLFGKNEDGEPVISNAYQLPLIRCSDRDVMLKREKDSYYVDFESIYNFVLLKHDRPKDRTLFGLHVEDDSMKCSNPNSINKNDIMYFEMSNNFAPSDIVIANVEGYDRFIVRQYARTSIDKQGSEAFHLIAFNDLFEPVLDAHERQVHIFAKCIGVFKAITPSEEI